MLRYILGTSSTHIVALLHLTTTHPLFRYSTASQWAVDHCRDVRCRMHTRKPTRTFARSPSPAIMLSFNFAKASDFCAL